MVAFLIEDILKYKATLMKDVKKIVIISVYLF